jgi:hypothetical protein
MIRRRLACVASIPMLLVGVQGCRRSPDSKIAAQLSAQATTPEQTRLWQQAADQRLATGLQKLEKTDRPVTARQSSAVANQAVGTQSVSPSFPTSVANALRITSTAGLDNANLSGPATVTDVDASGEQLTLDLGNKKTITFIARIGGRPFGVARAAKLSVEYHARDQRLNRLQILAVRAMDGTGIARITETGRKPLTVSVPLFDLEATQSGQSYTSVDVRVGSARRTLAPGDTTQVGGMTVGVIASRGLTGPDAKTLEGSPYAIELIAWSSR